MTINIKKISAKEAWEALKEENTFLLDVRTPEEWKNIGFPDLSTIGKQTVAISWRNFPSMQINENFAPDLQEKIKDKNKNLLVMCKSGGRSAEAVAHLEKLGYINCYNIYDGFEGQPDHTGQTGKINGWKAANLPWSLHA